FLILAAGLGVGYYLTADQWSIRFYEDEVVAIASDADIVPEDAPVYVPAIVDLPGDPMIISLGDSGQTPKIRAVPRPENLAEAGVAPGVSPAYVPARVDLRGEPMIIGLGDSGQTPKIRAVPRPEDLADAGVSERLEILSDTMISASERFMTTIPSSQEDFAFFQSQRQAPVMPVSATPVPASPSAPSTAGGANAGGGNGTPGQGGADVGTEIANTTSITFVTPEAERYRSSEDVFVKVLSSRSLESAALEHGFSTEDARLAQEAMEAAFSRD